MVKKQRTNKQTKSMAKKKKKAQHFNFKKNQPGEFYHKTIADAWDKNKTLQQNYAAMGLVMDVNTAVNDKLARVLTRKLQSGVLSQAVLAAGHRRKGAADAEDDDDDDDDDDEADATGAAGAADGDGDADMKTAAKRKPAKAAAKASGSSAGAAAAAAGAKGAKAPAAAAAAASSSLAAAAAGAGAGKAKGKAAFPFKVMPQELSDIAFDELSDDDGGAGGQSDAEVEETGNAKADAAARVKRQKKQIAKELRSVRAAASEPLTPYVPKTMPVHEQQVMINLKRKYGSDFAKMARDTTINVHQKTEAQLRKRMELYDHLLSL